ncbi:uncharacterized protein At5g65660-like [Diospyros lotus]|uniref:uncharacterized protein At5g65660-like n=1 Tax=Diospyros lotus TaxID=55363 RepID=UPI0022575C1D|nr:uncharacterized protein At5g65660-like [Diospyros lotus]
MSRPSLGYPLGLAILVVLLLCISGFFSCCYHWDKLRLLLHHPFLNAAASPSSQPPITSHGLIMSPLSQNCHGTHVFDKSFTFMLIIECRAKPKPKPNQSLSVLMPGDHRPKFVALPTPQELEIIV